VSINVSIRLVTLGVPGCHSSNGNTAELPAQKARFALLVYLAVEKNSSRDEVAGLFWPESDDEHARHALSQSIYELKRLLGESWLGSQGGRLIVSDDVVVDVHEFAKLCQAGAHERAVQLYHGPFLSGFFLSNCKGFEVWVERQRAQLERAHRRARRDCVNELLAAKRMPAAIEVARRWVELDPYEDEANHRLIELLVLNGDRTEALREFGAYAQRLHELSIEPLENTRHLINTLRSEVAATAAGAPIPVPSALESVSTPAQVNEITSQDAAPTPSLIGELSRRRVLRVAAWYAAAAYGAIEFTEHLQEALYLPPWILTTAALLCITGFPFALVLSWQFDLTPDGLKRSGQKDTVSLKRNWGLVAIALVLISVVTVAAMSTSAARSLRGLGRSPELMCEDGSRAPCRGIVPLEQDRFAVLPLQHQDGTEPGPLSGETCAQFITQGLLHWRDMNVADQLRINDALRRLSDEDRLSMTVDTGLAIARSVGAGKLIMGTLWRDGDTTRVTASLYDVQAGKLLRQEPARFATGSNQAKREFYLLAARLALQDADLQVSTTVADAATSFAAVMAYSSATEALYRWDFEGAKNHFRDALKLDIDFAYADLELANVMLWQGEPTEDWRLHAIRARAGADRLEGIDKLLAAGIASLSEQRFTEACTNYRQALGQDSTSFNAWYGLSECLARDSTVIRDPRSPSGWSFATSYEEAIRAHMRALHLVPSFNDSFRNLTASRLYSLLFLASSDHRTGRRFDEDTLRFAAYAALQADTISLVPYLAVQWAAQPVPSSNAEAIERHRGILKEAALAWARAFPDNPRALEALALSLELTGSVAGTEINSSALAAIRRARALESDRLTRLRWETAEVRMLVKIGQFKDARRRGRVILRTYKNPQPAEARRLAGIAGLVGDAHSMSALLVQAAPVFDIDVPMAGQNVEPPLALTRAASALLGYAYVGVPLDSIRRLTRRAHEVLDASVRPEQRELMHAATLDRAAFMTFGALGSEDAHRTNRLAWPQIQIQGALARGDTAEARSLLIHLDSLRVGITASAVAADGALVEAQLLLALRDTTAAKQRLDAYLNSLSSVSIPNFNQPYQPVSIVRMMALRAELAAHGDERQVARKWARAVVDLWQDGSKELRPTLRRMRTLARL
jgi:DNA-binding SARP family transcriptional activator/tetratricopeptide (TPR) repeat protein